MTQWTVLIPLEAARLAEPDINIFIEPGTVLDGIQLPDAPAQTDPPPVSFTCNGEQYQCERMDLETCARAKS